MAESEARGIGVSALLGVGIAAIVVGVYGR
jgi:hypothetical protein